MPDDVALDVRDIARDPRDGAAVIVLSGDDDAALPIWVDDEAAAEVSRAMARQHVNPPDDGAAVSALVRACEGTLRAARLKGGGAGVVGELVLASPSGDRHVEVRASLAIATALWLGAPLVGEIGFVEAVTREVSRVRAQQGDVEASSAARWNAWLERAMDRDEV